MEDNTKNELRDVSLEGVDLIDWLRTGSSSKIF
jgi:hypothetical protein